jgi:hypothetical protein
VVVASAAAANGVASRRRPTARRFKDSSVVRLAAGHAATALDAAQPLAADRSVGIASQALGRAGLACRLRDRTGPRHRVADGIGDRHAATAGVALRIAGLERVYAGAVSVSIAVPIAVAIAIAIAVAVAIAVAIAIAIAVTVTVAVAVAVARHSSVATRTADNCAESDGQNRGERESKMNSHN